MQPSNQEKKLKILQDKQISEVISNILLLVHLISLKCYYYINQLILVCVCNFYEDNTFLGCQLGTSFSSMATVEAAFNSCEAFRSVSKPMMKAI